ncbi:carbohydrate ABC transporter membrane protein 1, CUT1 family [Quadrisphaera granulorum]|uniref:Carbohydrate ABC transporter membrane protein 1 (CUT1 family) n=1 Tax=Quadrisphaera granulorum TaxID=317664 RepID=A0A315ZUP6_9ACTN|nr:sugar ABC transporter permease [Quadrisphaera granulorum]PWJ49052.1 carbohydrate ABC transporter membrane protein 1 (CUT1 family) [Quadrisphaera granulorum]SZE98262.1 carbohydrate ABC transporter membrane protein 1, CUT1 family [Quadrisphaera granulorum]
MSTTTPAVRHVPRWLSLPPLVAIVVLLVYPTVFVVAASFTRTTLARPLQEWTGFANLTSALQTEAFAGSLVRTLVFAVSAAVLATAIGTAVALLLRARTGRGEGGFGVLGTLLLLPLVTPPVMVGVAWKLLLAPAGGALTSTFSSLVGSPVNPLGSSSTALGTLVLIHVWQWTPLVVLLVFAALLGVPDELLEAASLDGAGALHTFTAVTWPVVAPTVLSVLFLELVVGFKVFDLVAVVTSGGPGLSTVVASFEVFRTGLRGDYDVGTAAAMTLVLGLLVGAVTAGVSALRTRAAGADA